MLKGWAAIDPETGDWIAECVYKRTPKDKQKLHTRPARDSKGNVLIFQTPEDVEAFLEDDLIY